MAKTLVQRSKIFLSMFEEISWQLGCYQRKKKAKTTHYKTKQRSFIIPFLKTSTFNKYYNDPQ